MSSQSFDGTADKPNLKSPREYEREIARLVEALEGREYDQNYSDFPSWCSDCLSNFGDPHSTACPIGQALAPYRKESN